MNSVCHSCLCCDYTRGYKEDENPGGWMDFSSSPVPVDDVIK